SDPQMDGTLPAKAQDKEAGRIYKNYGSFTTAASVLATWSLICELYAPAQATAAMAAARAAPPPTSALLARAEQRRQQVSPTHLLLQIAASSKLTVSDVAAAAAPASAVAALQARLNEVNVDPATSTIDYRSLAYEDEASRPQALVLAQVANDDAESFRGSYLFSGGDIVAQEEFTSS